MSGLAYRIYTPRLLLRCWQPTDGNLLQREINNNLDHLRPWLDWAEQEPEPLRNKIERLRRYRDEFVSHRDFFYGIFDRHGIRILGGAGLHPRIGSGAREIGYWISKAYTKRGFATESSAALTTVAFRIDGVERVEIHCDPENAASARVAEKLGFVHRETLFGNKLNPSGQPRDTMIWIMTADRYRGSLAERVHIAAFNRRGLRLL
jgi:RimJ/RimL family protein N-acetyltransferase